MIRTSIRRPVAVAMTYASVAALGVFAWRNIPLELLPDTQLPQLSVRASWLGASPETVEAFLTAPLEAEIQQVRGVDSVTSQSQENGATISIRFQRDTDMDFARLDLAERLSAMQADSTLPPSVDAVEVQRYVPPEFEEQGLPLLQYDFTGPYTQEALFEHLEEVVVPELSQIDGVARADATGGRRRLVEIRVNSDLVGSLGFTRAQIDNAIRSLDFAQEAGVVREADREWTITFLSRAEDLTDVREAVLLTRGGTIVRLGDIGTVHDTFEDPASLERRNSEPSLGLRVFKERGTNSVRVADAVKARLDELALLNPYGSRFINTRDESEQIREQLSDVRYRAMVAAGVIFVVLLLFLRSFRSAGVVFATIAFSVLIALNLIYFGGLALNILTLMGLAMGFGLIVDNSIVVLENIYRRWQGGEDPETAAEGGAREVVLPIFAATATTLIVFVPFVYLQDELRVFYLPLAIVVALTLLASLFVAFSFIPGVVAKLLHAGGARRAPAPIGRNGSTRPPIYVRFYEALVGFTLRHPWGTVLVTLVCLAGSWHLFDTYVSRVSGFRFGSSNQTYIDIRIQMERGENMERADQLARFFEERLEPLAEVEEYQTRVNRGGATITVTFPDSLEATAVPVVIKEQMYAYSLSFTGVDVRVYGYGPSFYGGSGGAPINYRITVLGYNYLKVEEIAEDLARRLITIPRVQSVNANMSGSYARDRATEFRLRVNRAALARYGMDVGDLAGEVGAFLGGRDPSGVRMRIGGEEVYIQVKTEEAENVDVLALREAMIANPGGSPVRLGDLVTIEPEDVLATIIRQDQQYQRVVGYEFRGPSRLGDIYNDQVIETTVVPPGYTVEGRGLGSFRPEEARQIWAVLVVSILLIYMVTAALFESLRQPLCVLLTVPMALVGVFMIFFYTGATFTREAWIGVIMMGGIVVNNSILLVDHVNRVRSGSIRGLHEAVVRGTLDRVRPILMTTMTTVVGLLPLVLFSEDTNIWNALALTLIGGLLSSTLFVLTVTPALYSLFERGPEARRLWVEGHVTPERTYDHVGG